MTTSALWRSVLDKALYQNRELAYARYFQLATVREDGRPANRTVVFRGFLPNSDQLITISDHRSSKISQIQHNAWAEICWYFPETREQFRLSGSLSLVDQHDTNPQRQQIYNQTWQNLSDSARAQFYWPPPSQPYDPTVGIEEPPQDQNRPAESFLLILLDPTEVDHLDLRLQPHSRHRHWCDSEQQWYSNPINP
jgi:pyridoxamine 5'-phosphate oxidase